MIRKGKDSLPPLGATMIGMMRKEKEQRGRRRKKEDWKGGRMGQVVFR